MAVQKSLYAIAGLGLGGCVVLMLMLDRTLKVVERPQRSPYEVELEAEFGAGLVRPPEVRELEYGGGTHLHAHLVVVDGLRKEVVVERAGARLWQLSERGGRDTVEVVIYVDGVADGPQFVRRVPRGRGAPRSQAPAVFTPAGPAVAPR